MNIEQVCALWFSSNGGTEQIARFVAWTIARQLGIPIKTMDFTTPEHRNGAYRFGAEDLLVMASPVYVGRLLNKLMPQYKAKIWETILRRCQFVCSVPAAATKPCGSWFCCWRRTAST